MVLLPWRKKKNDSIHLAHGGQTGPNPLAEHGLSTAPPATGVLPTGDPFPGAAIPPPLATNDPDTPSDPARITNSGVGESGGGAVNDPHIHHDQHWWAAHYPHTIHDPDGGPILRDDLAKTIPIQVNVSDPAENKPVGVSLGGESINVSSGVTDPTHPTNDSLKPWGGETMPNDAMGLSPHPEDKG